MQVYWFLLFVVLLYLLLCSLAWNMVSEMKKDELEVYFDGFEVFWLSSFVFLVIETIITFLVIYQQIKIEVGLLMTFFAALVVYGTVNNYYHQDQEGEVCIN